MTTRLPEKSKALGWMILPLRRYAQFDGRSGRREFWWFSLYLTLSYAAVFGILVAFFLFTEQTELASDIWGEAGIIIFVILFGIVFVGNFIPGLALTSRRLHDMGLPGWLVTVALAVVFFLNFIGWLGYMVVMSLPPQKGENQYGPPVYDDQIARVFD